MKITKAQSKQLRYICGAVDYNQPCTRKYTGGPEGKIREIGKFKYIEKEGELLYFEYDGEVAALSRYTADEFLSALADVPELLTEEEKKAAEEPPQPIDTSANIPPVESVQHDAPKTVVKPAPVKEDRWGEGLRETAMTAAAREVAMDCGIEGIPDDATSVDIVRACHTTPGFMECYGECLKKVGNPRSLEEIAEALPAQRKWLFK